MTLSLVGFAPWARSLFLDAIQLDGQGPALRLLRSLQRGRVVAAPRASVNTGLREVMPRVRETPQPATSVSVSAN